MSGRKATCSACGTRVIVRAGQEWKSRTMDASILIVEADRDGAIVEQADRPNDGRWSISYADLLRGYRRIGFA